MRVTIRLVLRTGQAHTIPVLIQHQLDLVAVPESTFLMQEHKLELEDRH